MIIIFALIVILFIYNYYEITEYKIEKVNLKSKKINENIKIVQISDFHSSKYINQDKLIKDIENYNPDIIFLTGDMIDGKKADIGITIDFFNKIKKLNKDIYFVIGNHEFRNINVAEFLNYIKELGVIILDNRSIFLKEYNINLAGITFGLNREEYNKAIDNFDEKNYNILLSHSPKYPINYHGNIEDLILSGHTHGGQVRIPFIGAIVSSGEGFLPKYDRGIFNLKKSYLYIDSGIGTTALPLRLFCKSQISFIEIDKE